MSNARGAAMPSLVFASMARHGLRRPQTVIKMDLFHEIKALDRLGESVAAIARRKKIDWKTAKKYAKATETPRYKPRLRPSKSDPFAKFEAEAKSALERAPELSAGELHALLRPKGYLGSERTISRRMSAWTEAKPKERFFEQEYIPGEQAQFDFKEWVVLPFAQGPQAAHLHFGTLPFSDAFFISGYPQKTFECFIDGVHSFFEKAGGMPKNVRIDNLSPCVKGINRGSFRDYTDAFERAIRYYGFGVLPCSPGKGNEKGDVERDIQTYARRFCNHVKVHDLVFQDFAHLNRELTAFCERERKPEVDARLRIEREKLLPLMARDEAILCRIEETRASSHGTVRLNKSTYSVPDEWIGLRLRIVAGPFETRLSRPGAQAIVHPRLPDGGESVLLEHVLKSLLRKPQAMVRWRHKEILFPDPRFAKLYKRLKAREELPGSAEREFLRVLNLIQYAPLSEIACAAELALEAEAEDAFAFARDMLMVEHRPQGSVIDLSAIKQTPLQPNLKDYDQLIPQLKGATG